MLASFAIISETNLYPCIGRKIDTIAGAGVIANMDDETILAMQHEQPDFINASETFSIKDKVHFPPFFSSII